MTFEHGGPDAQGAPSWNFSTNGHASGPCPLALIAVVQADARHYPDPTYTALRGALATLHAVDAQCVVLAGSASEFIARITAWVARAGGNRVWQPALADGDYARAAQGRAYEPLRLSGRCSLAGATLLGRVWQLWSPNKALGLTGVRGAYAIAPAHALALARTLERAP